MHKLIWCKYHDDHRIYEARHREMRLFCGQSCQKLPNPRRGHRFWWWWVVTYEGLILQKAGAEGRDSAFDMAEASARALYTRRDGEDGETRTREEVEQLNFCQWTEEQAPKPPPGPRYKVVLRRRQYWILDNYLPDAEPVGPHDDRQQAHDERDDLEALHSAGAEQQP